MKNQNKKRKKWRYVYRKFGITQRFNIEDTNWLFSNTLLAIYKMTSVRKSYTFQNLLKIYI